MDTQNQHYIDPKTVAMQPTAMRYGLYWGVAGVLVTLVSYLLGGEVASTGWDAYNIISSVLSLAITVGVIYYAIKYHRDQELGGYITTGRCASLGAFTGIFAGFISGLFMFIFLNYIAPDYFEKIMEMQRLQLEEGGMSDDQIDAAISMTKSMYNPIFIAVTSIVGSLIAGAIIGAIVGLFMKRESPRAFS